MESEDERKIKETVENILREADMEDMTEFKLRAAASARLGLDLSVMEYKTLVRNVMESFLLSTADEAPDEAEVPAADTTARDEAVAVRDTGTGPSTGGEDESIICKLSDKKNAVVRVFGGKAFLSIGERSQENRAQQPTFRGISLTADQWSVVKKNFTEIEEAIRNLQSKLRSQSNSEQKEDASDAVNDNANGIFPVEVSRFDGKNYLCWASNMELFLKQLKLAYVLTEPCPSTSIGPGTNPEEVTQAKAVVQKWINDDHLCHHHLLSSMSDHLYHQYSKKFKSAKELWDELKWVYLYEESGSRRSQVRKYIEFKMVEERPILEQIQDFNKIADTIVSDGMFLDESFHTSAIISKFPPSWKAFCIKLMQEEFLPVWMLMDRVRAEEELRRNGTQRDVSRLKGFQMDRRHPDTETRNRGKQNIGWKRKESVIVCTNCGRKGHLSKNCWGKKLDKPGNNVRVTDCPKEETL